MQVLRNPAQTQTRGLLRVLFLRFGQMPANPAAQIVLCWIEKTLEIYLINCPKAFFSQFRRVATNLTAANGKFSLVDINKT